MSNRKYEIYYCLDDKPPNRIGVLTMLESRNIKSGHVIREKTSMGNRYLYFRDHLVLSQHLNQIPTDRQYYHELIIKCFRQKPRFDIDISLSVVPVGYSIDTYADKVKDVAITSIITFFASLGITLNIESDVLIFASHGDEIGDEKRSYHIIIDNYMHASCTDASDFMRKLLEFMGKDSDYYDMLNEGHIDPRMWDRNKCLRLLGSKKDGSNRVKVFCETFTYLGNTVTHDFGMSDEFISQGHKRNHVLAKSLITFTDNCSMLPCFPTEYDTEIQNVNNETAAECMNLLPDYDKTVFSFSNIQGNRVWLKRHRPSMCGLCNKPHKTCPPYIKVIGNIAYWYCNKRIDGACITLGKCSNIVHSLPVDVTRSISMDHLMYVLGEVRTANITPTYTPPVTTYTTPPVTTYTTHHQ